MNFDEFSNVSSGDAATTKIGVCTVGGNTFKCIEKKYEEESYEEAVKVLERFPEEIKELGPHIHLVDKNSRTVYMEFIECNSLARYLQMIDATTKTGKERLEKLFESLNKFMTRLRELGLCHGDLHTENLLVCSDLSIRMIDVDTLVKTEEQGFCDDNSMLGSTMFRDIVHRLHSDKKVAMRDAVEEVNSRYASKIDAVKQIVTDTNLDPSVKKHLK